MESKEDKLSVPDLPETFEGRYNQLRSLVNEAVLSLLEEVKKRDALSKKHPDKPAYLTAPYGRLPPPTPLMTYDEFLALKEKGIPEFDMKIEDIPDPSFEFKYGFNPLTYISDYLKVIAPNYTICVLPSHIYNMNVNMNLILTSSFPFFFGKPKVVAPNKC